MSGFFELGRQAFAEGEVDWVDDDINVSLVDLNDIAEVITGATNATPIVVTSAGHGYSNGDVVSISGVGGNTAANGRFRVANVSTDTFELTDYNTGANVAGNGAYTSGGFSVNLTTPQYWDEVSAGEVATEALANKTATFGVLDADDTTFDSVEGDVSEALIIWKDTSTPEDSPLLILLDQNHVTGLPVTPNTGNISTTWSSGANKIARL